MVLWYMNLLWDILQGQ